MSTPDRRGMLDRADKALSIRRQCLLLGIARSGVYRPPRPANDNDLALMRRIDELSIAWPFLGRPLGCLRKSRSRCALHLKQQYLSPWRRPLWPVETREAP